MSEATTSPGSTSRTQVAHEWERRESNPHFRFIRPASRTTRRRARDGWWIVRETGIEPALCSVSHCREHQLAPPAMLRSKPHGPHHGATRTCSSTHRVPDVPPAAHAPRTGRLGGAHGLVGLLAMQRVQHVRVQHANVRRPRKDAALLREALGSDAPRAVRARAAVGDKGIEPFSSCLWGRRRHQTARPLSERVTRISGASAASTVGSRHPESNQTVTSL